jgi:hypothetical protein
MGLRARLSRLEGRVGPPAPPPSLAPGELAKRLEWWLCQQTYNRRAFDEDPAFRPAWSCYHRLWGIDTGGWSPLHAVWPPREPPKFEEARRAVLPIMLGVLERQPGPSASSAGCWRRWLPTRGRPSPSPSARQAGSR